MPGSGTLRQVERLEEFLRTWNWKPREVKLFFFGMSGSFSAGNDFVDNYDRYVREHAGTQQEADSLQSQVMTEKRSVGFAERLIGLQKVLLEHSMLLRLAKYYWGPVLKSLIVADVGEERMAIARVATRESLAKFDELSRRAGFSYTIYLFVPVQDIMRGTYGETLNVLNGLSPQPAVPTAQIFLDAPQKYYYAFDGHFNAEGSRRIAEFLIARDGKHDGEGR
jgi:hypothetical protein